MDVALVRGTARQHAIDQRSVIEAIVDNQIARAGQRAQRAEIGEIAGRKQQRRRHAGICSERAFQFGVQRRIARQQGRAATAEAMGVELPFHALDNAWMGGETQVVVAGEIDQRMTVERDARALRTLTRLQAAQGARPPALR